MSIDFESYRTGKTMSAYEISRQLDNINDINDLEMIALKAFQQIRVRGGADTTKARQSFSQLKLALEIEDSQLPRKA